MNKNSTRYFSSQQEKKLAKDLKGKCAANSGATLMGYKSDVYTNECFIECKTCMTDKSSFSIKKEWLEKLREQSIMSGKDYYALAFNFGPNQENQMIIPQWMFEDYLEKIKESKNG